LGSLVQVEHEAASAPHASWASTHTPLASHLPEESQAVIPSLQAPFTLAGCAWHVPLEQTPVAQSVLRPVQSMSVLTHRPPEQTSLVQALLSVQLAALLSLCWQPAAAEQKSFVHGLLSSQ
jgi:hypothetical protein